MAATDIHGTSRPGDDNWDGPIGPSDKEVVEMLQRVASARAHLSLAEQRAREVAGTPRSVLTDDANRSIENAHTDVLWAQAGMITERRQGRALKALRIAHVREKAVLQRYGYTSFRDYLSQRNSVPTEDVHLELARREYDAAQQSWEDLQGEFAPTLIVDLTGDEPRVVD